MAWYHFGFATKKELRDMDANTAAKIKAVKDDLTDTQKDVASLATGIGTLTAEIAALTAQVAAGATPDDVAAAIADLQVTAEGVKEQADTAVSNLPVK